ncbi:unnamed protein product [Staurois parvus]|uniref:Uncharacterized protein n=1 Tax=Staurois parvus TaxID=386267 RepID=A0ABN9AN22_9NEOB|nr:unnamed protein product [Staurois parvus]
MKIILQVGKKSLALMVEILCFWTMRRGGLWRLWMRQWSWPMNGTVDRTASENNSIIKTWRVFSG